MSHRDADRCSKCGIEISKGMFLQVARETGVRCLECAGLRGLVFLLAGDAALTRRAVALSARSATVIKFSRTRRRHERKGVLVEEAALETAKKECVKDSERREATRARRRTRAEKIEQAYLVRFTEKILDLFPACPREEAQFIAQRACEKHSGRVGRSREAKQLAGKAILLAVRAYVRHRHTRYDNFLAQGLEPSEARPRVAGAIEAVLARWKKG